MIYDQAYRDGYAAALDAVERIPTEHRVIGNDFVWFLDKLRTEAGLETEPKVGVAILVRWPR